MTHSIGWPHFPEAKRICRTLAAVGLLTLGACASNTGEDSATQSLEAGPKNTGSFPNLNIVPKPASTQFTAAQRASKMSELASDRQQTQGSGGAAPPPGDTVEMNRLAKNHAKDALKQIESNCDPALDPTCK